MMAGRCRLAQAPRGKSPGRPTRTPRESGGHPSGSRRRPPYVGTRRPAQTVAARPAARNSLLRGLASPANLKPTCDPPGRRCVHADRWGVSAAMPGDAAIQRPGRSRAPLRRAYRRGCGWLPPPRIRRSCHRRWSRCARPRRWRESLRLCGRKAPPFRA